MSADLDTIARLVSEQTGMRIGHSQHAWLSAAAARVAERIGAQPGEDISLLSGSDDFVGQLIDEVTIRETFFMRQIEQLRSIDWHAALEASRAAGRATVRAWSAGCASGEEAYTLGMLAVEALGQAPPVSIVGTDISTEAVACARRGWYTGRTVQRLDSSLLTRHFEPEEGGISVRAPLRRLVRFRRHNLIDDASPPAGEDHFDIVVCRNVVIHFHPEAANRAGAQLMAALQPQGMLLLAPADRLCIDGPALGALAGSIATRPRAPRVLTVDAPKPRARPARARVRAPIAAPATPPATEPAAERLAEAVRLADAGRLDQALEVAHRLAADDPLDASAHLMIGVLEMAAGAPERAVGSLRRAVFLDPSAAIAAFHLGRAREATGEPAAAKRAYEHALHALNPDDQRHGWLLRPVDIADVGEACRLRLLDLARR